MFHFPRIGGGTLNRLLVFHPGSSNLPPVLHFCQLNRHGVPPVESLAQLEQIIVVLPPGQNLLQLAGAGAEPAVEAGFGLDRRLQEPGQSLLSSHGLGERIKTALRLKVTFWKTRWETCSVWTSSLDISEKVKFLYLTGKLQGTVS